MADVRSTPAPMEVPVLDPDEVKKMRQLAGMNWGAKRIARELGVSRNTVRRYLRSDKSPLTQTRPHARRLDVDARSEAERLFIGPGEGNAVVVAKLLAEQAIHASVRTVQRAVAHRRQELKASQVATVRVETAAGQQMQIDFGQKLVRIAGEMVRVYLLVAVLSFSRRLFVKAFLSERQDDWREGIGSAFRHFGGVTRTVLGDNAAALVIGRDRLLGTVTFHPAYVAFLRDFGAEPRACRPYRARTKGKTESGVKYVKRNGLAGREFESFAALEAHLGEWMHEADTRVHGTTNERPIERFERERHELLPLPVRPVPLRERRLKRRVANDALVNVDTVRYSVPHRLVRETVEVHIAGERVRIYHGAQLVAEHRRSTEPHQCIKEPSHYEGLWKPAAHLAVVEASSASAASPLEQMGRSLTDYEQLVGGIR